MDHVKELLADLGRRIQEEENKVRQRIDRLSQYDDPGMEDAIREEWRQFHARIKPMQDEQQYVLKQLATIEAAKPPAPIIISNWSKSQYSDDETYR